MQLSIVIPVLNEAAEIVSTLDALQCFRQRGDEIIVVDGGSDDGTRALARPLVDKLVLSERGRSRQMNKGACVAQGDYLLFLHADTHLPPEAQRLLPSILKQQPVWGRFDVRLSGHHPLLRIVERMMNWRSRFTGIATGDQAIFVRKTAFEVQGGFPDIALMEDIAFSKRMRRVAQPLCVRQRVTTSSRRWEDNGIIRTIVLMWRLRLRYFMGAHPDHLAQLYRS